MQRLVEQPTDEGDVFEGSQCLGRVHYHLSVYQNFSQSEGSVLQYFDVEGRLTSRGALDFQDLHRRETELVLQLADGRLLDFTVAAADGAIRSTGRGLYR